MHDVLANHQSPVESIDGGFDRVGENLAGGQFEILGDQNAAFPAGEGGILPCDDGAHYSIGEFGVLHSPVESGLGRG
nr:hypothetical protein [Haloactinomyces albus]